MFSTPKNGWVDITIGNWKGTASYLTNPHLDLLDAIADVVSKKYSSSVYFDGEGWSANLVLNDLTFYIIEDKDEVKVFSFDDILIRDFMYECCEDISRDIDAWAMWDYDDETPADIVKAKARIRRKLKRTLFLLDKYWKKLEVN